MPVPAPLADALASEPDPTRALTRVGRVFAVFDAQDSGHLSYGVELEGGRWFIKTARTEQTAQALRDAERLHAAVRHPAIVPQLGLIPLAADGLAAVYPWVDGEVLYPMPKAPRTDPGHPLARFRALPVPRVLDALDALLDAHLAVTAAGFIAVDLYDGSMIYDFSRHALHLIDLDAYRRGPATRTRAWMGSTRFMAPEEHVPGAVIDERTTVFTLGRALRLLLDAGDFEGAWRGGDAQLAVLGIATAPDPLDRYPSVGALTEAWRRTSGHSAERGGLGGSLSCGRRR